MANYSNYNITLNGVKNAEQLVTFNYIPTILAVTPTVSGGQKAQMTITIKGGTFDDETEYFIAINDVKVYGTSDMDKLVNTSYYMSNVDSTQKNMAMAYYLCRALNNTKLANTFDIFINRQTTMSTNQIIIREKEYGHDLNNIETNMPSAMFSYVSQSSSPNDSLIGSKVVVDVYADDNLDKPSEIGGSQTQALTYIATLEKNYYKDGIAFDLSPLLTNYTENGHLVEYACSVTALDGKGGMASLGGAWHNFCLNGYSFDNGRKYFDMGAISSNVLLQNVGKYNTTGLLNKVDLYYIDDIQFSILLYEYQSVGRFAIDFIFRDSALNQIYKTTLSKFPSGSYLDIVFGQTTTQEGQSLDNAYYVDVVIPELGTLRYTNIKPLKYGDSDYYTNIYFHNSYGGVSFCPFTASFEEEYDKNTKSYSPSHFDLYSTDNYSYEKTYINEVERTVTLKSHYISEDGLFTYKDLMQSYNTWIYAKVLDEQYDGTSGEKYNSVKVDISIDDISFEEVQHHIYQCTLKYKIKEIK